MSAQPVLLRLRPSRSARAAPGVVAVLLLLYGGDTVADATTWGARLFALGWSCLVVAITAINLRRAVTADDTGLSVRNRVRTRRIPRGEIQGFALVSGPRAGATTVVATTNEAPIPLEVTSALTFLPFMTSRAQRQLAALQRWLASPH